MATGYSRQSLGLIVTGAVIAASNHENEFNALLAFANETTGHNHDGTAGGGSPINLTSSVTSTLPIASGGTGAITDVLARAALGFETTTVDETVCRFDGVTGQTQSSGIFIDDSDDMTGANNITINATPSSANHVTSKAYVDNLLNGLKWKATAVAATTANGTLATAYENGDTIDGVVLATGNRILIKDQTAGEENGIYTVNASGAPTRSIDADSEIELISAAIMVEQGTANADNAFVCTNDTIVLETTAIVFVAFAATMGALLESNNLSDVASAATSRTNLGVAIGSDVQAYDVDTAKTDVAQEYTAAQNFNATTLTSTAASIAWDLESNQVAFHTFTENTTLANPTNQVAGATYNIVFTQHASSPKTLAYGSAYIFPNGTAFTVTATNSAIDLLSFISDGTNMIGVGQGAFA